MTCAFCVDTGLMSTIFANKIRKFLPMRKVAELNIFSPNCACSCPGFAVNNRVFWKWSTAISTEQGSPADAWGTQTVGPSLVCNPFVFLWPWLCRKKVGRFREKSRILASKTTEHAVFQLRMHSSTHQLLVWIREVVLLLAAVISQCCGCSSSPRMKHCWWSIAPLNRKLGTSTLCFKKRVFLSEGEAINLRYNALACLLILVSCLPLLWLEGVTLLWTLGK